MRTNIDNMKYKKVLVVGFGRSGMAAAHAMLKLNNEVSIQDSKPEEKIDSSSIAYFRSLGVTFYLGKLPEDIGAFDMIVLSPGVSPETDFVREAAGKGVEITGELEIAYRISKGNYIAITGTNGKTTTTTLVGEIFADAGRKTYVGGNIGVAVVSQAMEAEENDWLVTEVSSFQLETTKYFRPKVSAILNITPDHLNRHHTMEAYAEAKAKVFANQGADGYLVVNCEDRLCMELAKTCRATVVPFSSERELEFGAFVKDGRITIRTKDAGDIDICGVSELRIPGKHNVENVLASSAICYFAGVDPKVIGDATRAFGGVEHRIEYCADIDGIQFYNDSKGTNTDAAVTALKALESDIVLIAGGDSKSQDFTDFAKELAGRVKKLILMGRDAGDIKAACDKAGFTDIITCRNMEDSVRAAYDAAEKGDKVLLSPACASWDMYDNFEQRGRHFKDCVRRLEH